MNTDKIKKLEPGKFGIIIANEGDSASQIALTEDQSILFQAFLMMISREKSLIKLPSEYDLVLESSKIMILTA